MIDLTITEALKKLKSREISATELARAHIDRIEKYNPELNAYITVTAERALADAAAADERIKNGTARTLDGIPIAMKDLFATRGIRTTAASQMLENFVPEYESTVSQKFIDSGTVLLGIPQRGSQGLPPPLGEVPQFANWGGEGLYSDRRLPFRKGS